MKNKELQKDSMSTLLKDIVARVQVMTGATLAYKLKGKITHQDVADALGKHRANITRAVSRMYGKGKI